MVGGDEATFGAAAPVLAHYGRAVTLMGGPGSGQLTKMFNQICIAGLVQALAEGINFADKAGLDVERGLEVISKGAAQRHDQRIDTLRDRVKRQSRPLGEEPSLVVVHRHERRRVDHLDQLRTGE